MIDLIIKTGRISNRNLYTYSINGYIPIFICRYMNPLVKDYEGTPLHLPELSPSPELLRLIRSESITYDEFTERYIREVSLVDIYNVLSNLYNLAKLNPEVNAKGIVLLCYCKDYHKCHRSILANIINSKNILNEEVTELYV